MFCPKCGNEIKEDLCSICGYDRSRDYLCHPTLYPVISGDGSADPEAELLQAMYETALTVKTSASTEAGYSSPALLYEQLEQSGWKDSTELAARCRERARKAEQPAAPPAPQDRASQDEPASQLHPAAPAPAQKASSGKKKGILITAILLVVLAVLGLFAGKAIRPADSGDKKLLGTYKLYMLADMTIQEYADLFEVSVEEAEKIMTLELKSGGKAVFTSDGEGETVDWKVEGEKLVLSAEGETLEGTIKDGIITLDFDGESIQLKK